MLYLYHRLECFAWYIRTSPRAAYQAKHECLWYKRYVPHYSCRLIARQYEVEIRIYYIDRLRKFDYGPAHASRNHRYTYVCQQKRANPMESVESSYKRLNSCFVVIALFHKVYYASKSLTFFLKRVSRVFRKWVWSLIKMERNTLVQLNALHLTLKQCFWVPRMAKMCISCCCCSFNIGSILSLQQ